MTLFMGLAAINTQANLLFGVCGLMIGVLLAAGAVCRLVVARLNARRVLPEYTAVGQPVTIHYQFTNGKRLWPSLSVTLAELDGTEAFTVQPQAYMLHAAPGMTATVPVELMPKRRGLHRLNRYQLSTSFPFGFIKRATERRQDEAIMVYPAVGQVSHRLLMLCRATERSTANLPPQRGGDDEFYGVKEYRQGENPRWIHWKRSAHTGQYVLKEMAKVSPPRLLIVVDTQVQGDDLDSFEGVEKSIAMAASLASTAMEMGMAVGLCAWANGWTVIPAQRGKRHCLDILAALAELPLNREIGLDELMGQALPIIRHGLTPVLFSARQAIAGEGLYGIESQRGGMVIVMAGSEQAQHWFKFDPQVDFRHCMPADQQPPDGDTPPPPDVMEELVTLLRGVIGVPRAAQSTATSVNESLMDV